MENKFKRKSLRLRGYDYSQIGAYFVTMCTWHKESFFGEIEKGRIKLSKIGSCARNCCLESPDHFSNIILDEYIIMPNHFHGIIFLTAEKEGISNTDGQGPSRRGVQLNAPTNAYSQRLSPKKDTLSVIIRTLKAAVTTNSKKLGIEAFAWQRNFYDHIIRNENEFNRIRQYILYNTINWHLDRENPVSENYEIDSEEYFKNLYI